MERNLWINKSHLWKIGGISGNLLTLQKDSNFFLTLEKKSDPMDVPQSELTPLDKNPCTYVKYQSGGDYFCSESLKKTWAARISQQKSDV